MTNQQSMSRLFCCVCKFHSVCTRQLFFVPLHPNLYNVVCMLMAKQKVYKVSVHIVVDKYEFKSNPNK